MAYNYTDLMAGNGASWNGTSQNINFMANVGWADTSEGVPGIDTLFSDQNVASLSDAITRALDGVDPRGRRIVVPRDNIVEVLSSVYRFGTRQNIGDIYTRYIVPQAEARCDLRSINNQTINIIVSGLRDSIQMEENNKKLTVWTTLLGDFNREGLRSHAPIKIKRRHPQYMAFNMNY